MKFTLSWLKEYLDTDASLTKITDTLTAIGLEVEVAQNRAENLAAFKVAQILDAQPHPDADKLQVCRVETGQEQLQIVCGAPNARPGINVVLAPVGSIIPTNGMKIKQSKIRGVESNGMLCSAAELGLGEDHSGIIEMPASNDNIAKDYADVAGLNDTFIEIAITPNRGDCLGVYGIARDLAAAGLGTIKKPSFNAPAVTSATKSAISVSLEDDACPYFLGATIENVANKPSPDWLVNRLESIGLSPISALVDITNYVAYCFGRPLHVYDADKIANQQLTVRRGTSGEDFKALDEKDYKLSTEDSVVADSAQAQALAGVIGGLHSGCSLETTRVFLEVAWFEPVNVAAMGRRHDIITDSRYRFERYVDPEFMVNARHFALNLILEVCGGEVVDLVDEGQSPYTPVTVECTVGDINGRLGTNLNSADIEGYLNQLGFEVSWSGENAAIKVPSWRPDVTIKQDITEEVARLYGYDRIEVVKLNADVANLSKVLPLAHKRLSAARRVLAQSDLLEVVTWSFMSEKHAKLLTDQPCLQLQNPISSELSTMRPSIVGNLLEAAQRNSDKGAKNLQFFEIGPVYNSDGSQTTSISGLRLGEVSPKDAHHSAKNADVFTVKADVLNILEVYNINADNLQVTREVPSYYHPGKAGALKLGKNVLAYFGELHPKITKAFGHKKEAYAFECLVDNFPPAKAKKSKGRKRLVLSEYQQNQRDFAFIVNEDVAAGDMVKTIKNADKQLIKEAHLFDVYAGKGIEDGKKSIAISVTIQAQDRTLTDQELEKVSQAIIKAAGRYGAELRG